MADVSRDGQWMQEIEGSDGTMPGFTFRASRGKPAQGNSRTGCGHHPARLGTVGLWIAGQEGKAINILLLPLGGSQMKHSSHKGEMFFTLTVAQEDVSQQVHKANIKISAVEVSCISTF